MKQKLTAILAVVMMCMSLTACGGYKDIADGSLKLYEEEITVDMEESK